MTASFDEDRPSTPPHDGEGPDVDPATGDEAETFDDVLSPAGLDRLAADVRDALADTAEDLAAGLLADPFTIALGATEAAISRLDEQIVEWVEARKVGNARVVRQRGELARLQSALRAMRKAAGEVPAVDDA